MTVGSSDSDVLVRKKKPKLAGLSTCRLQMLSRACVSMAAAPLSRL